MCPYYIKSLLLFFFAAPHHTMCQDTRKGQFSQAIELLSGMFYVKDITNESLFRIDMESQGDHSSD